MDNALGFRALHAVCVHVGHHIVTNLLLPLPGNFVINIVLMFLQLIDLLLGHRQSQFSLGLRQRDPQPPPCAKLLIR